MSLPSIELKIISPFAPDALDLIQQLNAHNLSHYSAEICTLDPPEILARENCTMLGAYIESRLVGIGAVKFFKEYGEIKRMFVIPEARGKGISKLIMDRLLEIVCERGIAMARLETGYKYKAAVNLYQSCGFKICGRFGDYSDNGISVFMERVIDTNSVFA